MVKRRNVLLSLTFFQDKLCVKGLKKKLNPQEQEGIEFCQEAEVQSVGPKKSWTLDVQ